MDKKITERTAIYLDISTCVAVFINSFYSIDRYLSLYVRNRFINHARCDFLIRRTPAAVNIKPIDANHTISPLQQPV